MNKDLKTLLIIAYYSMAVAVIAVIISVITFVIGAVFQTWIPMIIVMSIITVGLLICVLSVYGIFAKGNSWEDFQEGLIELFL